MKNIKDLEMELIKAKENLGVINSKYEAIEKLMGNLNSVKQKMESRILEAEKLLKEEKEKEKTIKVEVPKNGVMIDYETFANIVNVMSSAVSEGMCEENILNRVIALGKASEENEKQANVNIPGVAIEINSPEDFFKILNQIQTNI